MKLETPIDEQGTDFQNDFYFYKLHIEFKTYDETWKKNEIAAPFVFIIELFKSCCFRYKCLMSW